MIRYYQGSRTQYRNPYGGMGRYGSVPDQTSAKQHKQRKSKLGEKEREREKGQKEEGEEDIREAVGQPPAVHHSRWTAYSMPAVPRT